jgi:hypothetical protein
LTIRHKKEVHEVRREYSQESESVLALVHPGLLILALSIAPLARSAQPILTGDIPLLDARLAFPSQGMQFQVASPWNPDIGQAVGLGTAFHEAAFYGIDRGVDWLSQRRRDSAPWSHEKLNLAKCATGVAFLAVTSFTPLGLFWVHEEAHRAVLSYRGVASRDELDDFPLFSLNSIGVTHLSDSDLVRFKHLYPHDLIRAEEAGCEAQQQLVTQMERAGFSDGEPYAASLSLLLDWYSDVSNLAYLAVCTTSLADSLTAMFNRTDGANVALRDFDGLDYMAWVYDLFRPAEPYTSRGAHPSGVGINRYITRAELTPAERAFLKQESYLSLTSLLDPMLFGYRGITLGRSDTGSLSRPGRDEPLLANASVRHYLTSFGHTISLNFMFRQGQKSLYVSLLSQQNQKAWFPGLDLQLAGLPLGSGSRAPCFSPRLMLWTQPRGQVFTTTAAAPGGLVSARIDWSLSRAFRVGAQIEAKTSGWVAGNTALDPDVDVSLTVGF